MSVHAFEAKNNVVKMWKLLNYIINILLQIIC